MRPSQIISQKLLEEIRSKAKILAKKDKSKSYVRWLNYLSKSYGFHTFEKLMQKVAELERIAQESILEAEEERIWDMRLSQSSTWGSLKPYGPEKYVSTVGLPNHDKTHVSWPHCFSSSSLFSKATGPRRQIDGKLFSMDDFDLHFEGEELRVHHDETLLMAIMILAGEKFCGEVLRFSRHDLEALYRKHLDELGRPISAQEIARTLWRLTNCELKISHANFSGPIFIFADATKAPEKFRVRFNPKLPNLYFPIPIW